ncbi:M23 family metallopeptidase [Klenkia terrae]|uniref:M23 family metallopeptidase n=1 Tax=Klenkia terrae TaxID=1052259 RepID=A0ABU8E4S7_9ACTN
MPATSMTAYGRRPPARRPAALLAALVLGGAVATQVFTPPDTAGGSSFAESQDVAVSFAEGPDAGTDLLAQAQITLEQARLRLEEVAASRRTREELERSAAVMPFLGVVTSAYGSRWGTMHAGMDIAAPMFTQEVAAADGVVLRAGPATGFGLAVYIQHENGDVTVYRHMDSVQVATGDVVSAGDPIALVGNRGQSTGPHLHVELQQGGMNGPRMDPVRWLAERGVSV